MERYDYHQAMHNDILEYLNEEYTTEELTEQLGDRGEFYNKLYDDLWLCDSVTGNASGSYTFSTWQAEENICHNLYLLKTAVEEFGDSLGEAVYKGAEHCDVTIRCYLLGSVLYQVLDELEEKSRTW